MTTKNTTTKNTISLDSFVAVMQAGANNSRVGAMQTVFGLASALIHNKGKAFTPAEIARLNGWTADKAPSRKAEDKAERQLAERFKKQSGLSKVIAECLTSIPADYSKPIADLTTVLDKPDLFAAACESLIDTIAFFDDEEISTQKQLIEWFEGFKPEDKAEDKAEDKTVTELPPEDEKKAPSKKPTETSEKAAAEMAKDAIALLIAENPSLTADFAEAEKKGTLQEAIAVIGQAFNNQLKAAKAEIATLNKIKAPSKAKAKAKA